MKYKWTDAHRAAFNAARYGRRWKCKNPVSAETRERLSAAGLGARNSRFNPNRELVIARLKSQRFMRDCLRRLMVNKASSSAVMLGYQKEALIAHLERQFAPGMSWSNYGEWQIDHKRPVADFVANGIGEPSIVCALSNLQPLWRLDNLSKGDRDVNAAVNTLHVGRGMRLERAREGSSEIATKQHGEVQGTLNVHMAEAESR